MEVVTPAASPRSDDVGSTYVDTYPPVDATSQINVPQITDYVALGCLVVKRFSSGLLSPPLHPWSQSTLDHISFFEFPLRDAVTRLLDAKWIRIFSRPVPGVDTCVLRVYVLPQDVGRSTFIPTGKVKPLQAAFEQLLPHVNTSASLWNGLLEPEKEQLFDRAATAENNSLFYVFNTLPSPAPTPAIIKNRYARAAAEDLLSQRNRIKGLRTRLYPYQARSAAMMIQRESMPELVLDPRLELRQGPDGRSFYYCPQDGSFLKTPKLYESVRGGILSETMGLGKTLICIAVILATKSHLPRIPDHYVEPPAKRAQVASLSQMAISSANRSSVPLMAHLERLGQKRREAAIPCLEQAAACPPTYNLPVKVMRFQRKTVQPPPLTLTLCSGTIVVVPRNLVHQWELELRKHVRNDSSGLRTLVMNDPGRILPPADDLKDYDIILFSRQRFEREIADGRDQQGRRTADGAELVCRCPYIGSSRTRDCTCLREDDIYQSPLKKVHWLRLIIDEGHAFTSKGSTAVQVADKLVRAERRWIVSGTPARHRLFGVDVEAGSESAQTSAEEYASTMGLHQSEAAVDDSILAPDADPKDHDRMRQARRLILRQRKAYIREQEMRGAAQNLGQLATHFLKMRPFAPSDFDLDKVEWDDHIFRHEARSKTYTSFSLALRRTLEAMVIKTQPDNVERDIVLPPLKRRTVYLKPCFYDRLTINLFTLVINGNAVTSERTDQDYLFHENGAKSRNILIKNLRQSAFYWTGFTKKMVVDAIDTAEKYLNKDGTACLESDRRALTDSLQFARMILGCQSWQTLSRTHELGAFVGSWTDESASSWSLDTSNQQTLTGISQLLQAQSHVNSQLLMADPFMNLAELGETVLTQAILAEDEQREKDKDGRLTLSTATSFTDASAAKRHYQTSPAKKSPKKPPRVSTGNLLSPTVAYDSAPPTKRKRQSSGADRFVVPADSPIRLPTLTGTTSAKLSYLIDQVLEHQAEEKILIFYNGDDIAYYLAQYLDLLHTTYLIYARSLTSEQKAKYIVAFDGNPRIRVLIMDVHCGAEGLNVNKASRVYFINPCCRPNIEAQAIKRAHRIGQTRPVHVETLVLEGTVEEAMFRRASLMTNSEHQQAKELADDKGIAHVIQNASSIPMTAADFASADKMAPLKVPQQIFGRDGRSNSKIKGIDVEPQLGGGDEERPAKRRSRAKLKAKVEAAESVVKMPTTPVRNEDATIRNASSGSTTHQHVAPPTFSLFGGG